MQYDWELHIKISRKTIKISLNKIKTAIFTQSTAAVSSYLCDWLARILVSWRFSLSIPCVHFFTLICVRRSNSTLELLKIRWIQTVVLGLHLDDSTLASLQCKIYFLHCFFVIHVKEFQFRIFDYHIVDIEELLQGHLASHVELRLVIVDLVNLYPVRKHVKVQ